MKTRRKTLASEARISGRGLHTGAPVNVTVHPSDGGIAFRLGGSRWPATPEHVTDTSRSVRLGDVGTIEHLMSAFAGLEITDAEVELDAPELPGVDGSALPFVDALLAAGLEEFGEQEAREPFSRLFHQEEGLKVAVGKGTGHWRFVYDLGDRWPREQAFETPDVVAGYREEIAPARTIVLTEEIAAVQSLGLGRGLDETSVLILGVEGYLNEPRFQDEAARHKMLDLMGDLYLAGVPLRALNVVAERSGHRANVLVAHMLYRATQLAPGGTGD